jgi:hypothetical protein
MSRFFVASTLKAWLRTIWLLCCHWSQVRP